ncbi:hypothetical protein [Lysinibacillus sp. BPa_S21]|uniref:hypothetical protein n=1 Tax=Lysinibacillus sp. BPa_S21 TaxID=2932478 RepID=UPI0020114BFD|nr:hypothetical protein [Lysinibacillus sp. BPa_S21]MCL1696347.1 hypothetical protein [Lysinibacillus sp. BPa_S21]
MNKNYREIMLSAGSTIEDAVNYLLEFKEKGILARAVFNGKVLYSDTVTMDSAYLDIIGKTKSEFDKEQQERAEKYEKEKLEHEAMIPELTEIWIEKGKSILEKDKWDYWSKIVPVRLKDLYRGMELGSCLDIVKVLNNDGSFDDAKKLLEDQGHSGMSFGLVCAMVREFSDKGNEFVEYVG